MFFTAFCIFIYIYCNSIAVICFWGNLTWLDLKMELEMKDGDIVYDNFEQYFIERNVDSLGN